MDWRLFMVPIVGAVIGYATNWIAVKMLFYPHHEKRLFGRKLPFTPGVIPKGKERLARAAGQVIEKHLLNEEILRPVLLSDPMREKIGQTLEDWKQGIGDKSVKDLLADSMGENKLEALAQETEERISDHITEKILAMDPAALLVDKLMEEARAMLRALSGKTHHVLTGLYLRYGDRAVLVHDRSDVQFAPLSDREIEHYLDCGEYADKAGSYGIQGRAGIFVRKIDGDYQNVVGLPCRKFYEETVKLLGFWPY